MKETQVLSALFLPGHPELERRIQLAEIRRTLDEGGGRSFQERRQTPLASLLAVGLTDVTVRNYLLQRRAPLGAADHDRKSTRLNSSHSSISYAVFCLKKKK